MNAPNHIPEATVRLEGFGDHDLYQRREKIFTRFVGGFYQRLRFFTGWPLLVGYFLMPWLSWNGRQAVLFDLPARQFHVLGLTFWPQDFWLLAWLLIIAAFALFTFTTLVGRIWCGYTCPQTVWTAIFMWAEQITEGERHQRIRLDKAPWNFEKLRKRTLKHVLWLGVAGLTGMTFVGYFTPIRELTVDLVRFDAQPWAAFWVAFFTGATYVNAGWMREQVCIYMCPYARFQSAMFDTDTLIVSYDAARGEPRGARKRGADAGALGDCVDCTLCVQVCPTGIDIRDGLQYQCIGCAHCVDACNQVMARLGYDPGLIRYTTESVLTGGHTHWLRPRSIGYGLALTIMICVFAVALLGRNPFAVDVLRERGELYTELSPGIIGNQYRLRLMNKTQNAATLMVSATGTLPLTLSQSEPLTLQAGELLDVELIAEANAADIRVPSTPVTIRVCDSTGAGCDEEQTRFLAPLPGENSGAER